MALQTGHMIPPHPPKEVQRSLQFLHGSTVHTLLLPLLVSSKLETHLCIPCGSVHSAYVARVTSTFFFLLALNAILQSKHFPGPFRSNRFFQDCIVEDLCQRTIEAWLNTEMKCYDYQDCLPQLCLHPTQPSSPNVPVSIQYISYTSALQ